MSLWRVELAHFLPPLLNSGQLKYIYIFFFFFSFFLSIAQKAYGDITHLVLFCQYSFHGNLGARNMTLFAGRYRVTGVACGTQDVNFDSFQPHFSSESCYGTKYQTCLPWEAPNKIQNHNTI